MSIERDQLVASAVDGPLPAADAARLADALSADDATLTDLLDQLAMAELLSRSLDATRSGRAFAESLATRIDAESDTGFVHRIDQAIGRIDTAAPIASVNPRRTPTLRPPKRLVLSFSLAAALLLAAAALAIYLVAFNSKLETRNPKPAAAPLASVLESTGTLTADDRIANPGDEIGPGELSLDTGSADFRLRNGVAVTLRGATQLTVHDPMSATLTRGTASFDCPPAAKGYTVHLPGGAKVVDLGTRFIVKMTGNDPPAICVLDGVVRVVRGNESVDLGRGPRALLESGRPITVMRPLTFELSAGDRRLTFVQAEPFTDDLPGNTVRADEPDRPWSSPLNVSNDGLWFHRPASDFWPGFGELAGVNGHAFETMGPDNAGAPELVTTVTDLRPARYEVYVVFASSPREPWANRADLDAPAVTRRGRRADSVLLPGTAICVSPVGVTGPGATRFAVHVRGETAAVRSEYIGVAYRQLDTPFDTTPDADGTADQPRPEKTPADVPSGTRSNLGK